MSPCHTTRGNCNHSLSLSTLLPPTTSSSLHHTGGGRQKKPQPVKYSYSEVWPTGISYNVIDILYFSFFFLYFSFFLVCFFTRSIQSCASYFVFGSFSSSKSTHPPTLLLSSKLVGMVAYSDLSHGGAVLWEIRSGCGDDIYLKSSTADGLLVRLSCINLKPAKTADMSVSDLQYWLVLVLPCISGQAPPESF